MTFVDVDGAVAEVDFAVVAARWRGRRLGTALKAASVLTLLEDGAGSIRTGGSADNTASMRGNLAIGFVIDEQWFTLTAPAHYL